MANRYRLKKKSNKINDEKDGMWHAEPCPSVRLAGRELAREVTRHTTMSPLEMEMALGQLGEALPFLLAKGYTIELPGLGTLRMEYGSDGVQEPEMFGAHLIRSPRIAFRPLRKLTEAMRGLARFEPGGLTADGMEFASVADYRKWQERTRGADQAKDGEMAGQRDPM